MWAWKKWSILGVGLFCAVVGRSCISSPIILPTFRSPDEILIYAGGKLLSDSKIPQDSSAANAVNEWLAQHRSDWHSTYVTYVPVHVVKGEGFDLNFQKDRCILNYRDPGDQEWHQVMRKMKAGETEPAVFGN